MNNGNSNLEKNTYVNDKIYNFHYFVIIQKYYF